MQNKNKIKLRNKAKIEKRRCVLVANSLAVTRNICKLLDLNGTT